MVITRATEYAIRALLFLAKQPKGQIVFKKDICESQKITPAFLTKILQPLIKDGIVASQRGVGGGFYLLKAPSRISLLDVIKSQEGPIFLNHCLSPEETCHRENICPVKAVWEEANRKLVQTLSDCDFQSLADREQHKPDGKTPK